MSTTTFAYRDPNEGARVRFHTILERLNLDDEKVARAARVHARRTGRIWAGVTGIVAMAAVAGSILYAGLIAPGQYPYPGVPTLLLLAAWPAMGAAYLLGKAWSTWSTGRDRAVLRETENAQADLVRLEAGWRRVDDVRERADLKERGSVQLPLIALAFLCPLTLHWMIATPLSVGHDFDKWIMLSLVLVGHAHLVLAYQAARFARNALNMSAVEVEQTRSKKQWAAFGWTVVASALPGALFFLIPPIITAATGLIVAPLMFHSAARWIVDERRELGTS